MPRTSTPRPPGTPGAALRTARLAAGLTLAQLGARAHVDYSELSRVERGKREPWPSFRQRVAEALGLPEPEVFPEFHTAQAVWR